MNEERDQCPICLEEASENVAFLKCLHKIHEKCLKSSLKKNNLCPICRMPIKAYNFKGKTITVENRVSMKKADSSSD